MSKPNFRQITPLEVSDKALDAINDRLNVPTMVRAATTAAAPRATDPKKPTRTQTEKLSVHVPVYLMDAVRLEAAKQRISVRHIVMLALKQAGYAIQPQDLVPDGRRSERKSST